MTDKLEALLIGGTWPDIMLTALGLLTRARFTVDVISTSASLKKNRSMRDYFLAEKDDLLAKTALEKVRKNYALVVVGDDAALGAIVNSDLPDEEKLKLLPVLSSQNLGHIYSKIGLSRVLDKNGIRTPDYLIAHNKQELKNSARLLGYPLFIKIDSSSGGTGVFECFNHGDLANSLDKLRIYPVLMQKKIRGRSISLEAFYQKGKLVHFSYSTVEKTKYKFGPTSLRKYVQLACLEKKVFDELGLIGDALGADGFVNMSAIRADHDKELYFFEADMRPNLWADHSRFFGDDLAMNISRYFSHGETARYPHPFHPEYPEEILVSHYLRLSLKEMILNRDKVWRFLPENFTYLTLHYRTLPGLMEWARGLRLALGIKRREVLRLLKS